MSLAEFDQKKFDQALKIIGVTEADFKKTVADEFKRVDKDGSGSIDKKELAPVVKRIVKAMMDMGEKFTPEEKESAVDDVWKVLDADKSGSLDMKEFENALKLGILAVEFAADTAEEEETENAEGAETEFNQAKFDQALKILGVKEADFQKMMVDEFKKVDKDGSGSIDKKELAPVVKTIMKSMMDMGEKFKPEEKESAVDDVWKILDADKSGALDMKEFENAMKLAILAVEFAADES
ncbi:hypothetical protein AAMO2058_001029100 [Amorphochlora amoebiformis]